MLNILIGIKFTALGDSGHGSLLLNNTAAEKILRVINKLLGMRQEQKLRLESSDTFTLGDVTSVNLNMIEVRLFLLIQASNTYLYTII
jgi:aminoacylase